MADFMLPVRRFNILVVEDDDTVRRLLAEHLAARMPVEVDSARDGVEALHQISTARYDVIILDLMMPKMSGGDFLDSLRVLSADPSLKTLETPPRVLVITAAPAAALSDEVIRRRYPSVVREVFRKPLDIAVLAASVEKFLR
jgi:CheY-like chemotaxis protein